MRRGRSRTDHARSKLAIFSLRAGRVSLAVRSWLCWSWRAASFRRSLTMLIKPRITYRK
jgi:hypothetical protein